MDPNNIKKITELVTRYNSGVIALQNNPSVDGVAAGTALYLALSKLGKHMSIVCNTKQSLDLTGADKIQNSFVASGNHLVISFPYTEGAIDKVDYNIAGNSFNLIIVPTGESNKIDPKDVKFSYTGGKIEFIITVDVPNLNSLGPLYTENQAEFQGKNIINIDRHLINNNFGTVNMVNKTVSSTSELVYQVIKELGVQIDKDIATNLYTGLLAATNNFTSYSVNQNTFEASAELMKHGAVKKQLPQTKPPSPFGANPGAGFGSPAGGGFGNTPSQAGFGAFGGSHAPNTSTSPYGAFNNPPMRSPSPVQPMGAPTMDDFDDFDDFDDMSAPSPQMPYTPPSQPFGQPMRPAQQPPHMQQRAPMHQQTHAPAPRINQQPPQQQQNQYQQRPMHQQRPQYSAPRMPQQQQQYNPGMQQSSSQAQHPQQQQIQQSQQHRQQSQEQNNEQPKSPQDWLKPKLFNGNKLD